MGSWDRKGNPSNRQGLAWAGRNCVPTWVRAVGLLLPRAEILETSTGLLLGHGDSRAGGWFLISRTFPGERRAGRQLRWGPGVPHHPHPLQLHRASQLPLTAQSRISKHMDAPWERTPAPTPLTWLQG